MQAESHAAPEGLAKSWRLTDVHAGLIAATFMFAMLGFIAWSPGRWHGGGMVALLAALCCAAAAVGRPVAVQRIAARLDRFAPVVYLLVPLMASATVAHVENAAVPPEHQWRWFALWVASVMVVPFLAGLRISVTDVVRWVAVHRWELLGVAALTALAAVARFVRLDTFPSPFSGDEASFTMAGHDAIDTGAVNPFRFVVHGAPTLYVYYVGCMERLLGGESVVSGRASSAVLGMLAIPATYLFLRDIFNRTVAICGSIFLAAFAFHIQFSREAMPNIIDPLLIPLVLLFSYRAMRDGRRIDYALAGITLGLTLYAWISARIIPFELAALVGWWVLVKRRPPQNWLEGSVVALVAALIAAAPFGWYSVRHQDEFASRLNTVGIHRAAPYQPTWYETQRAEGRTGVKIYTDQFRRSFGAVMYTNDASDFYGANTSLIGPGVLLPLLLGITWSVWRVREPRYFLGLILFTAPIVAGGVLTIPTTTLHFDSGIWTVRTGASSARLLGVIPAVALLVGVGAERFGVLASGAANLRPLASRRSAIAIGASIAMAATLAAASLNYYFRVYDSNGYSGPITIQIDDLRKDMRSWVPPGTRVYFLETDVWNVGHPALDFGLRDYRLAVIDERGKVTATKSYSDDPTGDNAAFVFVGRRLVDDLEGVMTLCPNGTLHTRDRNHAVYVVESAYVAPATIHPCLDRTQ